MRVLFVLDDFVIEPLGVGYLSSYLKKQGHTIDMVKYKGEKKFLDLLMEIRDFSPDVLAYSITTGMHRKFIDLNNRISRSYNAVSIFGGSHPTYFPEMANEKGVDFIVRGEAERTFANILDKMSSVKGVKKVSGFYPLEQKLDRLPFPDRKILYKYLENRNNSIRSVLTSRGCRFSCPYCFNSIYRDFYNGQNWERYRSPEKVVEECLELKKNYKVKLIYFQDDEFLMNSNLFELLDLYREKVKIPFHCQIRLEFLTEDIARKLKDCYCSGVTFAVESGNDEVRTKILGRMFSKAKVLHACKVLKKVGLKFRIEHMCGIPTESLEQMFETLDFCIKCKPTMGWVSIFQPFPRLKLAEFAKSKGLWDGDIDKIKETFFEDTVLKVPFKKEIKNFQRLFGLVVRYSWLRVFMKWLIRVPNNRLYDSIFSWSKKKDFSSMYRSNGFCRG